MKDIKVSYSNRSFVDFVPIRQDNVVTFGTVEDEPKLLQSLVKLLLTPVDLHIFGYGTDYTNFDEDEIMRILKLYNDTTETDNPSELVDTVNILQISSNEYEVIITTQKGTEISLKTGI